MLILAALLGLAELVTLPASTLVPPRSSWLARHQDADGRWNADDFDEHDPLGSPCGGAGGGAGGAQRDVACTSLALLAFLGGDARRERGSVNRGLEWLRGAQHPASGRFAAEPADHALATLVWCELAHLWARPKGEGIAERGLHALLEDFDSRAAWARDPIASAWALQALVSARSAADLAVDREAIAAACADALAWIEASTNPTTGRAGATSASERGTAIALFSRYLLGQTPRTHPIMLLHIDVLDGALRADDLAPVGSPAWLFSGFALYQAGGRPWRAWREAARERALTRPAAAPCPDSFPPLDPWTRARGRIASTAQASAGLTLYMRYSRLVGAR